MHACFQLNTVFTLHLRQSEESSVTVQCKRPRVAHYDGQIYLICCAAPQLCREHAIGNDGVLQPCAAEVRRLPPPLDLCFLVEKLKPSPSRRCPEPLHRTVQHKPPTPHVLLRASRRSYWSCSRL